MSAIQLKEGIWSVGVINPSLRVFDVIMESKYGTSYNAYLLTGDKNILIETVHADYFDEYAANIETILPLETIDYLIMNHTEPDHSGSVALLLEQCPKLTVICSSIAKNYLSAITNLDFQCQLVKDGDTLDIGGKTLHFMSAPLLHWPDTMFTWDPKSETLFTCDFLGSHFCEPTMLDSQIKPHYMDIYKGELAYYYACIFGPFPDAVQKGLDKIPKETTMVCPSHGPVLTDALPQVMEQYRQWSTPAPKSAPTAAVLYTSAYGYTKALAEAAAQALGEVGFEVTSTDLSYNPLDASLVNTADVLLLGVPTINRSAHGPIWSAVHAVDAINTKGRAAGAFGSYGWTGEAPLMIHDQLKHLKFKVPDAAFRIAFRPTAKDLDAMATYAKDVAKLSQAVTTFNLGDL